MTTAASSIYELALELESKNQQVSRQLFGQDSRLEGEITLTMPHDILDYCLIDELAEFREAHPAIQLNLLVAKGLKNLAAREADVAIRLTPEPPDYLIGKEIAKLQHGIYVNTKINFPNKTPLVVWSDETTLPAWAEKNFFYRSTITVEKVKFLFAIIAFIFVLPSCSSMKNFRG